MIETGSQVDVLMAVCPLDEDNGAKEGGIRGVGGGLAAVIRGERIRSEMSAVHQHHHQHQLLTSPFLFSNFISTHSQVR